MILDECESGAADGNLCAPPPGVSPKRVPSTQSFEAPRASLCSRLRVDNPGRKSDLPPTHKY
jgi:hypothetical protein